MQQRVILNAVQHFQNPFGLPGLPFLCLFRGWSRFGNLRDIAPSFGGWKAKHKNVVAFLDSRRTECWNFRGFLSVALASATRLPAEIINEVVNGLWCDGAHDPIAKIGVNVGL